MTEQAQNKKIQALEARLEIYVQIALAAQEKAKTLEQRLEMFEGLKEADLQKARGQYDRLYEVCCDTCRSEAYRLDKHR